MGNGLSPEENQQQDRFLKAYNTIDSQLREALGLDRTVPFGEVTRRYRDAHPRWQRRYSQLRPLADLRNLLTHENRQESSTFALPTSLAVSTIEAIAHELISPERAIPRFEREVSQLEVSDSLAEAAELMRDKDYSQFPVYESGRFVGVLTERGLARWLVGRVGSCSIVEFEDEKVESALQREEDRPYFKFARREAPVGEIAEMFAINFELEVVLITESGRANQKTLGIATPWDIARLPPA